MAATFMIGSTIFAAKEATDLGGKEIDSATGAKDARDKAAAAAQQQADQQAKLVQDQKQNILDQQTSDTAIAARDAAKARSRALTAGSQGISSTILTSPLGITSPGMTSGKTLLGS